LRGFAVVLAIHRSLVWNLNRFSAQHEHLADYWSLAERAEIDCTAVCWSFFLRFMLQKTASQGVRQNGA